MLSEIGAIQQRSNLVSTQSSLGRLRREERSDWQLELVRWMLPVGWCLAAIGFLGPWVSHPTAALTLAGVDMGEFVKFLPGVLDGSLQLVRQWFYLPPFVISASIALLIGSHRLHYGKLLRALGLLLAIPVSLQLLPPAWSPASLLTAEFRAQTIAFGISWLLLAAYWLIGRLPSWLPSSLSAALCLGAIALSTWQYVTAKPAIDQVYGLPPGTGWGLILCLTGLAISAAASTLLVLIARGQPET
jgi:hypothetical protein